jgi:microcystin-dependent protein
MIDSSGDISTLSYPTGMIMLWYPPDSTLTNLALVSSTIPTGWAICDGTKGTPDLRGRFVLMAQDSIPKDGQAPGSSIHPIMSTGGEETHSLTVAEMPAHNHTSHAFGSSPCTHGLFGGCGGFGFGSVASNNAGNNSPHNTMPPFYTLVYIMKL